MPRYVIKVKRAVWVREVYETEAESQHEAKLSTNCRFLGFSVQDACEGRYSWLECCEQTDATPCIEHPANEPDAHLIAATPGGRRGDT